MINWSSPSTFLNRQTQNCLASRVNDKQPTAGHGMWAKSVSSRKATSDDFNDLVLHLGRDLVVAGEAQAASEGVRANVRVFAVGAGVHWGFSIAVADDEGVHPLHRLHMHGFPDWSMLGGDAGQTAMARPSSSPTSRLISSGR